jgi:hypothetical protein
VLLILLVLGSSVCVRRKTPNIASARDSEVAVTAPCVAPPYAHTRDPYRDRAPLAGVSQSLAQGCASPCDLNHQLMRQLSRRWATTQEESVVGLGPKASCTGCDHWSASFALTAVNAVGAGMFRNGSREHRVRQRPCGTTVWRAYTGR